MIAVVFPGQGSQKPGMGRELFNFRKESKETFEAVSDATGKGVAQLCFEADEDTLRQTENAQIALFTVSVAAYRCLMIHLDGHLRIDAVAGHSVGEYAASVCAGMLDLADAARTVQERGRLMALAGQERPGTMAAILGLESAEVEKAIAQATGVVAIANDNCPGQIVISGEIEAVAQASAAAQALGAKRVVPLNVSGAFHSPLMKNASEELFKTLSALPVHRRTSVGPLYANATAQPVGRETDLPTLLRDGLSGTVRWTELIENMANDGIDTFIECGVGDVLCGLIRRIHRGAKTAKVQDLDSLELTVATLRP